MSARTTQFHEGTDWSWRGSRRSFLRECLGYLSEFLKVLGSCSYAKFRVARSLSCLSVDMLLGGDADYVMDLFQDLVLCLQESGCLGDVERDAATNEFKFLVVDLRQRCVDCSQISDVFNYLEGIESYQCWAYVKQIVQLVRVIVCPAPKSLLLLIFPLVGRACLRLWFGQVSVVYNCLCCSLISCRLIYCL